MNGFERKINGAMGCVEKRKIQISENESITTTW